MKCFKGYDIKKDFYSNVYTFLSQDLINNM